MTDGEVMESIPWDHPIRLHAWDEAIAVARRAMQELGFPPDVWGDVVAEMEMARDEIDA